MADENKPGGYAHIELLTSNVSDTRRFYEDVFGWTFTEVKEMNYTLYETPAGEGGGLRAPDKGEMPGSFAYIGVKSVDEAAKKIEAAGGKIMAPKQEVPGYGWLIVFQAPGGVVQAVWQAAEGQQ